MKRSNRRQLGILIVLSLMLFTIFAPVNVLAETNTNTLQATDLGKPDSRFGGIDQYETSAKIAEAGWKGTSYAVVLAAGTQPNLIDAMSAGPLAAMLMAPLVLTDSGNQLNPFAKAEITRLKPQKAYITSGLAVIKPAVLEELKSMGVTPVELGGYDQYETAVNIAKEMQSLGDKFTKLYVVAGWVSPADALSIGSIAASEQTPILTTTKNELPAKVKDYVDSLSGSITNSYVIGGTAVVSDEVKNSLPGNQQRYYGNTKYDTNLDVLKKCADKLKNQVVYIANGETLVDALAGVPLAALDAAPIILTAKTMDPALLNYAKTNLSLNVIALGGKAVVNQETLDQLSSYENKNPALKITAPQDGAVLDYDGEVTVTWAAVPGATGYTVEVHDLDNPWPYLADWVTNIPAGTQTFTLPKYRITTTGHHYVITVHYEMPIDPDVGSAGLGSMPPIQVQIGKSPNISPLVITSPGSDATFSFGTQIPLQWNDPSDASKLNAEVLIQGNIITEFPIQNGQDISQHLYQGKNHVTVSLKSDDAVLYQGSLDITMIPSSPMSDTPDILTPSTGSTIDPNHPLTVTWKPVAGATDYSISVYREDGSITQGVGFFHTGTLTSFQLYPLSDGQYHMFVRAEVDNLLRDGDLITVNAPKADPSIVSPPPLNIIPLQIVSPTNNITVTGNEPVILKWNVPKFATFLNADVRITSSLGYTSGYYNGENINRAIQKDMNALTPGVNHVTVTLSESGDITQYQGSVDIIYNP
ncbi:cell wall-binding repeat-containing protein [Desulfosporosinus sp. OT]|uniref:cell wall-binding repeat-containing protein n=1 Tax=Desulfosporosinus sp. OT TaxID=913865 RepID=UPI000223AB77|nr:cell wall-binding repeat-containing protein [Desulfosporosinus sp. OT]EGW41823.1 cell wall binding repeat 2 family protein [Desulfosporosinus sp. OT]